MSMSIPLLPRVDRGFLSAIIMGIENSPANCKDFFKKIKKIKFPVRTPPPTPSSSAWRGFRRFRASPFFFRSPPSRSRAGRSQAAAAKFATIFGELIFNQKSTGIPIRIHLPGQVRIRTDRIVCDDVRAAIHCNVTSAVAVAPFYLRMKELSEIFESESRL